MAVGSGWVRLEGEATSQHERWRLLDDNGLVMGITNGSLRTALRFKIEAEGVPVRAVSENGQVYGPDQDCPSMSFRQGDTLTLQAR
jgi:hypothetical protein